MSDVPRLDQMLRLPSMGRQRDPVVDIGVEEDDVGRGAAEIGKTPTSMLRRFSA